MKRKASRQRDMILEYILQIPGHITAEEIYKNMNAQGQTISLATVYRNLGILVEMHEIKKIAHPIEGYQYDKTCKPHYHLHCRGCDRIFDLDMPYMASLNTQIQEETGILVETHDLMVEGLCEACAKQHRS